MKCTKIVATLGPSSSQPDTVEQLLREGADVIRLNFSHGNHADHARSVQWCAIELSQNPAHSDADRTDRRVLFFDLDRFFSLDFVKSQQAAIDAYRDAYPGLMAGIFFFSYVAITALSLPVATLMASVAGAIFGVLWGTVLASFASTLGSTLVFLAARFLLRDWACRCFGDRLQAMNAAMARQGGFYLFTLRLTPIFPFFMVNLAMGLTPIRAWTFVWVSQIGMLAGTLVCVNAGAQLARIDSLQNLLSPGLLLSLVLLGLLPLVVPIIVYRIKARRIPTAELALVAL